MEIKYIEYSNTGIVTRPSYWDRNAHVVLTATITKGSVSDTKDFHLTILALPQYSYEVKFDSQNADIDATPTIITVIEPDTKITSLPSNPVKSGFEFGGWFTEPNGNGTQFTTSTIISDNITVYANWNIRNGR